MDRKSEEITAAEGCGWALGMLALTPIGILWWAFATQVLWGWFVVDTFRAPALSLEAAAGIRLLAGFIASRPANLKDNRPVREQCWSAVCYSLAVPAYVLSFGWLVHRFLS